MELKINLDNIYVNNYEETVASLIKAEIDNAVRAEVRKIIKNYQQELSDKVMEAVRDSIRNLSSDRIVKIAKQIGV